MPEKIGLEAAFDDADFRKGVENYDNSIEAMNRATDDAASKIATLSDNLDASVQPLNSYASAEGDVAAESQDVADSVGDMAEAQDQATAATEDGTGALDSMRGVLTDVNSAMQIMGRVVAEAQKIYNAFITTTVDYANEVRKLNSATQTGAEATSILIQVADDAQVSFEALTMAAKTMADKGIQPTIGNIADLADKYNALTDPMAKSTLLMDTFGRSGLEMGKLLVKGSAKILESADAARELGLALTDEDIQNAIEYQEAIDDLADSWAGFTTQVGKATIPKITQGIENVGAAAGGAEQLFSVLSWRVNQINSKILPGYPPIVNDMADANKTLADSATNASTETSKFEADAERILRKFGYIQPVQAFGDAIGDYTTEVKSAATFNEQLALSLDTVQFAISGPLQANFVTYTDTITTLKEEEADLVDQIAAATKIYGANSDKVADLNDAYADNKTEQDNVAEAAKLATAQIIYQKAAVGLDATAALELARAMGLVSDSDYNTATAIDALNKRYQQTGDLEAYKAGILALNQAAGDGNVTLEETEDILYGLDGKDVSPKFGADTTELDKAIDKITSVKPKSVTIAVHTKYTSEGEPPVTDVRGKRNGDSGKNDAQGNNMTSQSVVSPMPTVASTTIYSNEVILNMNGTNVNNGMDLALLQTMIQQVVSNAIQQ